MGLVSKQTMVILFTTIQDLRFPGHSPIKFIQISGFQSWNNWIDFGPSERNKCFFSQSLGFEVQIIKKIEPGDTSTVVFAFLNMIVRCGSDGPQPWTYPIYATGNNISCMLNWWEFCSTGTASNRFCHSPRNTSWMTSGTHCHWDGCLCIISIMWLPLKVRRQDKAEHIQIYIMKGAAKWNPGARLMKVMGGMTIFRAVEGVYIPKNETSVSEKKKKTLCLPI